MVVSGLGKASSASSGWKNLCLLDFWILQAGEHGIWAVKGGWIEYYNEEARILSYTTLETWVSTFNSPISCSTSGDEIN
jgi:hypothetical protein